MFCAGVNEALLLISFGVGYFVIYVAKKGDKGLQFLGYFIGTLIMLLSLIFLIKSTVISDTYMSMPGMMKHRMMMPAMRP